MKMPKAIQRYCPHCRKHQEHKIIESKRKTPGSAHPLSQQSKIRAKSRGMLGIGNHGRRSRKAVSQFKMTGKKQTKKTDLRFQCKECKKSHVQRKGFRTKKLQIT